MSGGQALVLPGFAVIVGECDVCAVLVQMLFVVGIEVGDEEKAAGGETNDAGPLAAVERVEEGLRFHPGLAAVGTGGERHAAVDVGVLAAEAEDVSPLSAITIVV